MGVVAGIASVFLGCCSNVVFLELLVKEDPGSGNLITFSQFLFIAVEGFIFTMKCGTKNPRVGIWNYSILVIMFFIVNVCNNYAFDFNVAMPLHMIFRAGSLIANMIMGIIILRRTYVFSKYLSVGLITLGIIICTIISGQDVKKTGPIKPDTQPTSEVEDFFWWTVGIALLTLALFISARMGIYQEELNKTYGKNPDEALYFTHLLPLPAFFMLSRNIYEHFVIALQSDPLDIPLIPLYIPKMIVYLMGNVLTQYLCISSVYFLMSECSSLTVTLVITLRKFVSLLFSVIYFQNPFTIWHWLATLMVFTGTLVFTEVPQTIMKYLCISSVYFLTSECSSLTVTLVITLRKFVSLLFSIIYFENPFTLWHWFGTLMVFTGTLIFTEVPQRIMQSSSADVPKEKKAQ